MKSIHLHFHTLKIFSYLKYLHTNLLYFNSVQTKQENRALK